MLFQMCLLLGLLKIFSGSAKSSPRVGVTTCQITELESSSSRRSRVVGDAWTLIDFGLSPNESATFAPTGTKSGKSGQSEIKPGLIDLFGDGKEPCQSLKN